MNRLIITIFLTALLAVCGLAAPLEAAETPLALTLDLEYADPFLGDPVILVVHLVNEEAMEALQRAANIESMKTSGLIPELEEPEVQSSTSEVEITPISFLTTTPPWYERIRIEILWKEDAAEVAVLSGEDLVLLIYESPPAQIAEEPLQAQWAIPPSISAELEAGLYEAVAYWEGTGLVSEEYLNQDGQLISSPIEFAIRPLQTDQEKAEQYHRLANYFFLRDEYDKAREAALEALAIDTEAHLRAYYIVAEAYVAEGNLEEAIAVYEEFLSQLPPDVDKAPTGYMIESILQELRQELQGETIVP